MLVKLQFYTFYHIIAVALANQERSSMPLTIIIGAQWGDEGKGKITDLEASSGEYGYVVRYDGGNNAGHTVVHNQQEFKLHIIPSGILHSDIKNIIGPGTVVDTQVLTEELKALKEAGITDFQLTISPKAHLVLPWHRLLDGIQEETRLSAKKIGTTKRGMGPVRADKHSRSGLRVGDLLCDTFKNKFMFAYEEKKKIFELIYGYPGSVLLEAFENLYDLPDFTFLTVEDLFNYYMDSAENIKQFIQDTSNELHRILKAGNRGVLFEGAQGVLLDLDHGTYPFVTSATCGSNGAFQGAGVAFNAVSMEQVRVVGVVKAYSTRIGTGPFPTFRKNEFDGLIRKAGNEYGATTGRPRMCAPIDLPLLRYASRLNGFTEIAITKLDILSCLEGSILVGLQYSCLSQNYRNFGYLICEHEQCALDGAKAVFGKVSAWGADITEIRHKENLPADALEYVKKIERACEVKATYISVGPERNQTISC